MHSNHTDAGSGHSSLTSIRQAVSLLNDTVHRTAQKTRPAQQPSPRRLVTVAALAAAVVGSIPLAQHVVQQVELHSAVMPLAPAPAPPAPPPLGTPKHHLLRNLHPLAGLASWYGSMWNGRTTASGETYDESELTAAHRTLPLGTLVRVTNLRSMHSVIVRINDRGAFAPGRIIDLSSAAARELGMLEQGMAHVKLEVLGKR